MDNAHSGAEQVSRVKGRRSRFYVFSITALTVFLICAVIWPMRVRQFQSTSTVQLRLDKSLAIDKQKIKSSLVAALTRMTSDDEIEDAIKTVGQQTSIRSQWFTTMDRSQLRDRLAVKLIEARSPLDVRLSIEFTGDGTPDETELVNHFTTKLVSEFSQETIRITAAKRQAELKHQVAQIVNELNVDQQQSLLELERNMRGIKTEIEKAKDLCATETVETQTQFRGNDKSETIMGRIGDLRREEQNLVNEQNLNEFHPRIVQIRQSIEQLLVELRRFDQQSIQSDDQNQNRSRIKNRFTAVSTQKKTTTIDTGGFQRIHDQLAAIDVADSLNKIGVLDRSFRFSNRQQKKALEKIDSLDGLNGSEDPQVTLANINLCRSSQPVGGVPSLGQVFLLLISSLLMAAAVTAVFNPSLAFQPFASTEQITQQTGLPVIGTIPAQPEQSQNKATPKLQSTINGLVRLCELFLILAALTLVTAAVMKTGFLTSFFENPFHAAAKIFGG